VLSFWKVYKDFFQYIHIYFLYAMTNLRLAFLLVKMWDSAYWLSYRLDSVIFITC